MEFELSSLPTDFMISDLPTSVNKHGNKVVRLAHGIGFVISRQSLKDQYNLPEVRE